MELRVFLSTAITGVHEDEYNNICKFVETTIRNEYDALREEDTVTITSNFFEIHTPDVKHKKLHHLEKALNKMKDCDIFFLLQEADGSTKPGCLVELSAWISAEDAVQPIVRKKPKDWKYWRTLQDSKGKSEEL